jgi:protein-S-isoprenylcysteine O-methyltransferase Ste14
MSWALAAGAVALSALLLWLRDRFRDLRHVPAVERKRSERRNAVVASALVSFVYSAGFVYHAFSPGDKVQRIVFGLLAVGLLGAFWGSVRLYRRIGGGA